MKSKSVLLIIVSGLISILLSGNCFANNPVYNQEMCCDCAELDSCIELHNECVEDYNDCYIRLQKSNKATGNLIKEFEKEQKKIEAANKFKFFKGFISGGISSSAILGILFLIILL